MRPWQLCLTVLLATSVASPNTYTVRNKQDSGLRSLRWAIDRANAHGGRDVIDFAPKLDGATIVLLSQLPDLTDDATIIDGDIDDDGTPDIGITGRRAGAADGLVIRGSACVVRGLAIAGFAGDGIRLSGANSCQIRGCYLGLNLGGGLGPGLGGDAVRLTSSHDNTIGGTAATQRNVISSGVEYGSSGISLIDSSNNSIFGNYIGLTPDGQSVLGAGQNGMIVSAAAGPADGNRIGGEAPGAGNTFGGLTHGVVLEGAGNTRILGNLFGLKADGKRLAEIRGTCVRLWKGATSTQIGGTSAAARNVFAGGAYCAIEMRDSGTTGNVVQGNYFGTNQAGTRSRRLYNGIIIWYDAGLQTIGGSQPAAGNYFVTFDPDRSSHAVSVHGTGFVRVRNNVFGLLPAGRQAAPLETGIFVRDDAICYVMDNTIAFAADSGLRVWSRSKVSAFRNVFRNCQEAVSIDDFALCRLGNLGNARTGDDGGNTFRSSNTWFVYNLTSSRVKAEGNRFGTTDRAAIDARIYDNEENPASGRVDFSPLMGGVIPSGDAVPLTVAGATALPTKSGGAEIAFALSAPAEVTVQVLNVAGRPVATVARERSADAGLQRIVWSRQTAHGTRAPAGRYVVRIAARDADGEQQTALCGVTLP